MFRLTRQDYLTGIRRVIASKYAQEVETQGRLECSKSHFMNQSLLTCNSITLGNVMDDEQKAAYQQLLKKRSETLKKTSTDQAKK